MTKSKTQQPKQTVNGHKDKVRVVNEAIDAASSEHIGRMRKYAECLVGTEDCEPVIFPAPVPGRSGVARFPLVVDISGADYVGKGGDILLVARPDMSKPLQISKGAAVAEDAISKYGHVSMEARGNNGPTWIEGQDGGCFSIADERGGLRCLALTSAAGATLSFNFNIHENDGFGDIFAKAWDGSAWVTLGSPVPVSSYTPTAVISGVTYSPAYTHFTFTYEGAWRGNLYATWRITPTVGTTSCGPIASTTVMDTFVPPGFDEFTNSVESFRVVAMAARVTYRGPILENAGMIAVCNADPLFSFASDPYATIASRPFDVYDGRLTDGAHWHYVPDDAAWLSDRHNFAQPTGMAGFFGISGLNTDAGGGALRVRLDVVVNFFSLSPQYRMEYQPAYRGFSELLHLLRTEVPLVSSNGAVDKLKKLAKDKGKQAAQFAIDNPALIAKALAMLASML